MPATSTVAALTLVLAINLTDAAVFPTDDANGNTRKATIAQMRTQLNTGPQIFTSTISVAGTSTLQAVTATGITVTAATASRVFIDTSTSGAGDSSSVYLKRNGVPKWEFGNNIATALDSFEIYNVTLGGTALRISAANVIAINTTVTTGASAGDIVIANSSFLKGVNAAGTNTLRMIYVDSSNRLCLDANSLGFVIANPSLRTTIGANGAAAALTALPVTYVDVTIAGQPYQLPLYNRGA
jgi:hypothetical protein